VKIGNPAYLTYRVPWLGWLGCFLRLYGRNAMRSCPKCTHPNGWHCSYGCLAERNSDDGKQTWCPCKLTTFDLSFEIQYLGNECTGTTTLG
jgi:hypothetical protein